MLCSLNRLWRRRIKYQGLLKYICIHLMQIYEGHQYDSNLVDLWGNFLPTYFNCAKDFASLWPCHGTYSLPWSYPSPFITLPSLLPLLLFLSPPLILLPLPLSPLSPYMSKSTQYLSARGYLIFPEHSDPQFLQLSCICSSLWLNTI